MQLPTGNHICEEAVRSVYRRGFYDVTPFSEQWPYAADQFGRLAEEIGELIEASSTTKMDLIAEESADVLIVLCQLAWLYDLPPSELMVGEMGHVISLSILEGRLWRSMRKHDSTNVRVLLRTMAIHVRQTARIYDIDIEQAMKDKLQKDEQRGVRHAG